jgi:acyl carrier protein
VTGKQSVSQATKTTVIALIAEVLKCTTADIEGAARMGEIPNWDSISNLELILTIEEQFGLEIPPIMLVEMTSVEGILETMASLGVK